MTKIEVGSYWKMASTRQGYDVEVIEVDDVWITYRWRDGKENVKNYTSFISRFSLVEEI